MGEPGRPARLGETYGTQTPRPFFCWGSWGASEPGSVLYKSVIIWERPPSW